MDHDGFVATVQERAGVPRDEAQRAACATLRTLAERLSSGETEDLAERLPDELRGCLEPAEPAPSLGLDGFLARVAERAGIDRDAAEREARAVFVALGRAVGPDELDDVRNELPGDFDRLLRDAVADEPLYRPGRAAPGRPALSAEAFLERVAQRTELHDHERARHATEAVLEALAMRLSGGQVDDLVARVPPELRGALQRGLAATGGRGRPMSVDEFEREVAEREGVPRGAAAQHARAVLRTLRECVGETEWEDTTAQLPGEYRTLLRTG